MLLGKSSEVMYEQPNAKCPIIARSEVFFRAYTTAICQQFLIQNLGQDGSCAIFSQALFVSRGCTT